MTKPIAKIQSSPQKKTWDRENEEISMRGYAIIRWGIEGSNNLKAKSTFVLAFCNDRL